MIQLLDKLVFRSSYVSQWL